MLLTTLSVAGGAAAMLLAVLWSVQRRLIYFPLAKNVPPAASLEPKTSRSTPRTDCG